MGSKNANVVRAGGRGPVSVWRAKGWDSFCGGSSDTENIYERGEEETEMKSDNKPRSEASPAIGDRLLTLREAAEVLRLSTRTVREYLKRGEIRGKIIGNRWRFARADLDAFFENAPDNWEFAGKVRHGD